MRLFVKAKQVTKHCLEKERIQLNYNASEFDGTMILTVQSPTLKRPVTVQPVTSNISNGKHQLPAIKDFMCSIW
jgi:hypothetical protein